MGNGINLFFAPNLLNFHLLDAKFTLKIHYMLSILLLTALVQTPFHSFPVPFIQCLIKNEYHTFIIQNEDL
jgi:hypothetical protein